MKPDTPLEALTHYLWPAFVVVLSILAWFIKRELTRTADDLRAIRESSEQARDLGIRHETWSEEHTKSDDRQFADVRTKIDAVSNQVDDVRTMVFDNEAAARERERERDATCWLRHDQARKPA